MEHFLTIKLFTYAKPNCLKIEQIIYIKMDLALTYKGWYAIKPNQTKPNYGYVDIVFSRWYSVTEVNGL